MATDRPLTLPGRAGQLVMPLTLLVALAGCVSSQTPPKVAGSLQPAPAQPHVRVDGAGLLSDDVQRAALTPEELVTRVDDLLAKDRPAAARHLIERYPDVALKVLPTATYGQAHTATFQTIAQRLRPAVRTGRPRRRLAGRDPAARRALRALHGLRRRPQPPGDDAEQRPSQRSGGPEFTRASEGARRGSPEY